MNPRSSANGIRVRQQLREVDNWAVPLLEAFDGLISVLERKYSIKTDHASTFCNLRIAAEREVDAVIQEIQGHE